VRAVGRMNVHQGVKAMKRWKLFLAFTLGCLVASLIGQVTVDVKAQDDDGPFHVCVAQDGVMRVVPYTDGCPTGQRSVMLKEADAKIGFDKPKEKTDQDTSSLDKTILEDLNRRLINLESLDCAALGKSKVVAPFEVVDRAGKRIFVVDRNAAGLYNSSGDLAAKIIADTGTGGFFTASGSNNTAVFGFTDQVKGFGVREGDQLRIDLGKDLKNGNYRLRFASGDGQGVALIGQAADGRGVAFVGDGKTRAGMTFINNKGVFTIFNNSQQSVAELTEGESKGGRLAIFSSSGENMVVAGAAAEGFGVVRAGPEAFKPGVGILGLPGSFIVGKKQ
jgi:hypothetical protein